MISKKTNEPCEEISQELLSVIETENKKEMNQKRRYYRHNVSYELLQEQHFYYKSNYLVKNDDHFDSILDFSETIENNNLYDALKQLKGLDIEIITMRYEFEMSFKEIAQKLGMKEDTVGKRHKRALERLKKSMLPQENKKNKKFFK